MRVDLLNECRGGNAGLPDRVQDLIDGELVVLGDILKRLVDFGFGGGDLVLARFLQLDHFVFEGAQDLGADLRQIVLGRAHARGGDEERRALIEIVIRNDDFVDDGGDAGGILRHPNAGILRKRRHGSECRSSQTQRSQQQFYAIRHGIISKVESLRADRKD